MSAFPGSAEPAAASGGRAVQPKVLTAVAWAVAGGVAGFVLSITLGAGATIVTFALNPDEGASFIGIWFWLAGPPVSALTMAAAARWRGWDRPRVWQSAALTFAVCLGLGLLVMSTLSRPPIPPAEPSPVHSPVSLLPDGQHTE